MNAGVGSEEQYPTPDPKAAGPGRQLASVIPTSGQRQDAAERGFVAGRSKEDVSKRTARSTEFANPDGTRTLRTFEDDMFVRGSDGSMTSLDTRLEAHGDGYRPRAAADVIIADHADSTEVGRLTISPDLSAGFSVDAATSVPVAVDGSTARFTGVRAGADLELQATASGLKEQIILSSASDPTDWLFPLKLRGLTPSLSGPHAPVLLKDAAGVVRAAIPPGSMTDASTDPHTGQPTRSAAVQYELLHDDGWVLRVRVDSVWLRAPERVFPVKVDPTIRLAPQSRDTEVTTAPLFSQSDNSWFGLVEVGTLSDSYIDPSLRGEYAAYLAFDMWGALNYKYVLGATLNLWEHSATSCSTQPLTVYAVRQDWGQGALAWPGPAYDANNPIVQANLPGKGCAVDESTYVGAGWVSIALPAERFTQWTHAYDFPLTGFTLRTAANRPEAFKRFGSANGYAGTQPFIDVVYSTQGAAYSAPTGAFDPPVTGAAKGRLPIRVTNWGEATWTPTNGYRLQATVLNNAGSEVQRAAFAMPGDVTQGWSMDVPVEVGPLSVGSYTLRLTMLDPSGQTFEAAYGVPSAQVGFAVGNGPPTTRGQYPPHNGYVETLTPSLWADYIDPDNYPTGGQRSYWFQICNGGTADAPTGCRDSGWQTNANWPVPAGVLDWSKTAFWYVKLSDSQNESGKIGPYAFTPVVAQPDVTAHLAGASDGAEIAGINPQVGNYSTQAMDAAVAVVGPPLQIARTYNSQDPRTTGAFGAGWSTLLDQRVDLDGDGSGNAVVTLESGRQVRFGRSASGAYAPPPGTRLTLAQVAAYSNGVGNPDPPTVSQPKSGLSTGERLERSASLVSPDGRMQLWLRDDGNLVLYQRSVGAIWATATGTGYRLINQPDGNLVLYRSDGTAVWSTGTYGNGACTLQLQDDGNLVLYRNSDGKALWASGSWANPASWVSSLAVNQVLASGACLYTPAARARLCVQTDGNLVLTDRNGGIRMWQTGTTNATRLVNQPDGNLVLYRADGTTAWSTGTGGKGASTLRLQSDGNLVLYRDSDNAVTWATNVFFTMNAGMIRLLTLRDPSGTRRQFDPDGRLTVVTDSDGRVQTLHYPTDSSHADRITDQTSGRALSVEWLGSHVSAVSADAPASGQVAPRWTYAYVGDRLRQVCSPLSADACTVYDTVDGSHYRTHVLDGNPVGYWPVGEASGGTAVNVAARSADEPAGQYSGITLGQPGALAGSPDTAARFGGSTEAALRLPDNLLSSTVSFSIELWFKADAGQSGVLFAEQTSALGETTGDCIPALYVGTDGRLRGVFPSSDRTVGTPITSPARVDDGLWHHAVLSAAVDTQTLYLDGGSLGQVTGRGVSHLTTRYTYVGNGRATASWPSAATATTFPFTGLIDEVAVYRYALAPTWVTAHVAARAATARVTKIVSPGSITEASLTVDARSGRVATVTDRDGANWTVGAPSLGQNTRLVTLSSTGRSPITYTYDTLHGGRLVSRQDTFGIRKFEYNVAGFQSAFINENNMGWYQSTDARGNVLNLSAWRDGGWRSTASTYFLNANDPLDPRNDKVTSRSGGLYNNAGMRTSYTLDSAGRVTDISYPWLEGTTTHPAEQLRYSKGTEAAIGGGTVPRGLLVSRTTASGAVTTLSYDRRGDLVQTIDPQLLVTDYTRDALGRVTAMTVSSGADSARTVYGTTTYDYNAASMLVHETAPAIRNPLTGVLHTAVTTTTYDVGGRPRRVEVADSTGGDATRGWTYDYDPSGRPSSTTAPDGQTETRTWNINGDLSRQVSPSGLVREYRYDDAHRLVETAAVGTGVDPMDDTKTRLVLESRAYDPAGRLATVIDAMGAERAYTYHNDGLVETERLVRRNAQGTVTSTVVLGRYEYDEMGRLARKTSAGGVVDEYAYNFDGTLAADVRDPLGLARLTTYQRDAEGNPTGVVQATGLIVTPGTDGELPLLTDNGSQLNPANWRYADNTTSWTYKIPVPDHWTAAAGRFLINNQFRIEASPDGQVWTEVLREPNDRGDGSNLADYRVDLTSFLRPGKSLYLRFSDCKPSDGWGALLGRLIIEPTSTSVKPRQTTSTFDTNGQVLTQSVSEPGGDTWPRLTSRTYDARGLLVAERDATAVRTSYAYDAAGNLVTTTGDPRTVWEGGVARGWVEPQSTLGRNTFGDITSEQDPLGAVTRIDVDAAGRPLAVGLPDYTMPGGAVISATARHEYDAAGREKKSTDPLGNVTERSFDPYGNLRTVTQPDPDGPDNPATRPVWDYRYDRLGRQLQATDPTGAQARATYDEFGHMVTASTSDRIGGTRVFYTTAFGYDDAGNQTIVTTPLNHVTTTEYNSAGQPTKITYPSGRKVEARYDALGQRTTVINADARAQTFVYDVAGLVESTSDHKVTGGVLSPPLRTTNLYHDNAGRLTQTTTGQGRSTNYGYDAVGQLTSVNQQGSDDLTALIGYDRAGRRTRTVDANGNTTLLSYNAWGLPESTIEPSTTAHPAITDRTWTTAYDAAARPVSVTSPGNVSITRTFDALGRLQRITGTGAEDPTTDRSFGYDATGRVIRASRPGGEDTYTYNDRGLLAATSGPTGSASFTYNGEDLLDTRQDAAGSTAFTYDSDGRLATATDPLTGRTVTTSYATTGELGGYTYGSGGAVRTFTYDDLGRLATDTTKQSNGTVSSTVTYGYDLDGLVTNRNTTKITGGGNNAFTYDGARRLETWTRPDGTTVTYGYDKASNRTSVTDPSGTRTFAYDARNRMQSADGAGQPTVTNTYTARGTLATSTTGTVTTTYRFDAFDQLTTAAAPTATTTYQYDGLGRLAKRSGADLLYNDLSNRPVRTPTALGDTTIFRDPTGEPLSDKRGSNSGRVLATDHNHGDLYAAYTTSGALSASAAYTPWGEATTSDDSLPLGFQGGFTDPQTKFTNAFSRWYSPAAAGFTSRDTLDLQPDPVAQTNRYSYANANPTTYSDPTGHCPTCAAAPVVVAVGGSNPVGWAVFGVVLTAASIVVTYQYLHRNQNEDDDAGGSIPNSPPSASAAAIAAQQYAALANTWAGRIQYENDMLHGKAAAAQEDAARAQRINEAVTADLTAYAAQLQAMLDGMRAQRAARDAAMAAAIRAANERAAAYDAALQASIPTLGSTVTTRSSAPLDLVPGTATLLNAAAATAPNTVLATAGNQPVSDSSGDPAALVVPAVFSAQAAIGDFADTNDPRCDDGGGDGGEWVDPDLINFSQRTVAPNDYVKAMLDGTWDWSRPGTALRVIDRGGQLVSYDNRRLDAARQVRALNPNYRVRVIRVDPNAPNPAKSTGMSWDESFEKRMRSKRNRDENGCRVPWQGLYDRPRVE